MFEPDEARREMVARQLRGRGIVSAQVLEAIRAAVDERLRLYPNPTAQPLRERLAQLHGCKPANIIVGNGSDELLAMAVRAFVEPGHPSGSAWVRQQVLVQ